MAVRAEGGGDWGLTANGYEVSFQDHVNSLELDSVNDCTIL